jgi:hypothetical protein
MSIEIQPINPETEQPVFAASMYEQAPPIMSIETDEHLNHVLSVREEAAALGNSIAETWGEASAQVQGCQSRRESLDRDGGLLDNEYDRKLKRQEAVHSLLEANRITLKDVRSQLDKNLQGRQQELGILTNKVLEPLASSIAAGQTELAGYQDGILAIKQALHDNKTAQQEVAERHRLQLQERAAAQAMFTQTKREYEPLQAEHDAEDAESAAQYQQKFEQESDPNNAIQAFEAFYESGMHDPAGVPESEALLQARQQLSEAEAVLRQTNRDVESLQTKRSELRATAIQLEDELVLQDEAVNEISASLNLKSYLFNAARQLQDMITQDIRVNRERVNTVLEACEKSLLSIADDTLSLEQLDVRDQLQAPEYEDVSDGLDYLSRQTEILCAQEFIAASIASQPQLSQDVSRAPLTTNIQPLINEEAMSHEDLAQAEIHEAEDPQLQQVLVLPARY